MVKFSFKPLLFLLVFLGSAVATFAQPALKATLVTPANNGVITENCTGANFLVFERDSSNHDTIFITIQDLGVALMGVDYNFAPGTFPLTFLPTLSAVIVPVVVVNDGLPEGPESLIWEIHYEAGPLKKTITITSLIIDNNEVQIVSTADTIQWCRFAPLTLQATSASPIQWSPAPAFDPATGAEVTVRPFTSGWYYAMVGTDTCGAKDSIYLDLAIVNINNADTVFICKEGTGITLNGELLGLAEGFQWIPSDTTLSDTASLTPVANPDVTTTYILQSDFGVCIASDTIVVRVDSLPQDLHIDVAPAKPYYCEGEIAALFSSAYDSLLFPDLTFNWTPFDNSFLSEQDLLNAALQLLDTTTYIRESKNNACSTMDSITLNVVTSGIPISLTDTTLCPGEMFQVIILSNQVTEPEWMPAEGLSCTECLDPNVTVLGEPGSSVIYMFSGMILECPVNASLLINIPPPVTIGITADPLTVCDGDVVSLNITNPENLTNLHWTITEGNATLSCNDCTNPTLTVQGDLGVTLMITGETTDSNFCTAIGGIVLPHGSQAPVLITASDNIICEGDVVSLNVVDPNNYSGLHWNILDGDVSLSCTDCINPDITINSNGTVKLSVSGESNVQGFCGAYGEIILMPGAVVQQNNLNTINACKDSTVIASTGDPNLIAYHWEISGVGGLSISCSDCPNPTVTVTSSGDLQFFAISNFPDTCYFTGLVQFEIYTSGTGTIEIKVPEPPDSVSQGEEVMVMLNVSGATPTNIQWSVNGVAVGGNSTTLTFNANSENNLVEVTFLDGNGCPQSASINIHANPPTYQIPNAFTPGGSPGMNDKFRILPKGNIVITEFRIFNRWGQMVYEGPENDLEGWDGNFKGKEAASDTYVYVAEIRFPDGRVEVAKGDVILLR